MAEKPPKATASVKSGTVSKAYVKVVGGFPEAKTIDQIEKTNRPGKAPGSAGV